jgi:TonB family protein
MRLHLIESDHGSFQTAECAVGSLMLHAGLIWMAVGVIAGGGVLLADGRATEALFLVPPDRKEAPPAGQTELFQTGQAGGYFAAGPELAGAGSGTRLGGRPYGRQRAGERSSAIGLVPLGPPARPADSVRATFVVDTTGSVDTASVRVLESDDPQFTESVLTALGGMRFRPATRGGRAVRQLVEQRFNFRIAPGTQVSRQMS